MNPLDLFNQVKEMIEKKDFDAAKKFVDDNKDNLGDYLEQAKGLVSGNEMVSGALDKINPLHKRSRSRMNTVVNHQNHKFMNTRIL